MLQDQSLPPSEGVPAADADAKRVVRILDGVLSEGGREEDA